MSKRMTVEEWHVKNGGSNARNRDLQLALWDWQNDRVELMQQKSDLLAALKDIAKGEGAYSRDALTHANNTITNMTLIAKQAIADVEKGDK